MLVGVPKEIKNKESRVGLTPTGVRQLVNHNHTVFIEKDAGASAGFSNEHYTTAGATLIEESKSIYEKSEMVIKVQEPLPEEYPFLKEGQILFAFLHLPADLRLAQILIDRKVVGFAYETVQSIDGALPLLCPMSTIAGRMAPQIGANLLQYDQGGKGIILGGLLGNEPAQVVIVGGGTVGIHAAQTALALGAKVTILESSLARLQHLSHSLQETVTLVQPNSDNLERAVIQADLVIGAILLPGLKTPQVITRKMVSKMEPGSVIVDVSAAQGGTIENCRMTSHEYPTYILDGVVHYAVPNIPGAVPRTSTRALTEATLPYVLRLANQGWEKAIETDSVLKNGLNLCCGKVTHPKLAQDLNLPYNEVTT